MKEKIINKIKDLIIKVIGPDGTITVIEDESFIPKNKNSSSRTILFKVNVKDSRLYTSNQADALLALNHLAKKIIENNLVSNVSQDGSESYDLLIDINDFHKRKIEAIQATVHMMAERARYFKSNIEIDPMSAFERKIVHEFLADATDLKTESQGEGHQRRVVIKYIGDSLKN